MIGSVVRVDVNAVMSLHVEKIHWKWGLVKVSSTIVVKTCTCRVGCSTGLTRYIEMTGAQ